MGAVAWDKVVKLAHRLQIRTEGKPRANVELGGVDVRVTFRGYCGPNPKYLGSSTLHSSLESPKP